MRDGKIAASTVPAASRQSLADAAFRKPLSANNRLDERAIPGRGSL